MEYAQPSIDGTASCIRKPEVQANNFELKPLYVNMIKNSVQLHGLPSEDPNLHIAYFLDICDMFRVNGVLDDAMNTHFCSNPYFNSINVLGPWGPNYI